MSNKKKVFIDGSAGTTGLRIRQRLEMREDIELLVLSEQLRKDTNARKEMLNKADAAFLCLPDEASIEAVKLVENKSVVLFDTSTAHRTNSDWAYGFPELSQAAEQKIRSSKRIAVPGCHASGFIALVYPLIEKGVVKKDELFSCFSLTGYSGGGKKMIAQYEENKEDAFLCAPRQYGISQSHKHLKEMKAITGIDNAPVFIPVVDDFYSGMQVTVPLFANQLCGAGIEDIKNIYKEKYCGDIVYYTDENENGFASTACLSGKDSMAISVFGNEERMVLTARYDNLGKGASGAAIECMNTVFGLDKACGLEL